MFRQFSLLLLSALLGAASPFAFRETAPGALGLFERGKPVFVYNYGPKLPEGVPEKFRRCCYLHPVYTPGGVAVTDDFPRDHYHHRGIFWAWHGVTVEGHRYDLWVLDGVHDRFERWIARGTSGGSARLAVENGWFAGDRKIVKETVEVVAHRSHDGKRAMDFSLSFEAQGSPVELAGDPQKGYSGFSVRFAPRQQTVIRTPAGVLKPENSNMERYPWAELEATYPGGRRAGLRIDINPANPDFPNGWCLRHYGFLGVNFPGLTTYRLEPGHPLRLKYRVLLWDSAAQ